MFHALYSSNNLRERPQDIALWSKNPHPFSTTRLITAFMAFGEVNAAIQMQHNIVLHLPRFQPRDLASLAHESYAICDQVQA
jgi:hypothetical protein